MQVFVPVSHCKDTHNFDKTNNLFKKVKEKETKYMVSLCIKLTELLYKYCKFMPVTVVFDKEQEWKDRNLLVRNYKILKIVCIRHCALREKSHYSHSVTCVRYSNRMTPDKATAEETAVKEIIIL